MPPELLEHFKSKSGNKEETKEESEESNKMKRKEAVKKARIRMEEKSRGRHDKQEEAGKTSS